MLHQRRRAGLERQFASLFRILDARRQKLGMSYAALARKSGVSMTTVVRILSGRYQKPSLDSVLVIADILGMEVSFREHTNIAELQEQQAKHQARRLIGVLQGTSALEAQALDKPELEQMTRRTVHELLAGSKRRLWDE